MKNLIIICTLFLALVSCNETNSSSEDTTENIDPVDEGFHKVSKQKVAVQDCSINSVTFGIDSDSTFTVLTDSVTRDHLKAYVSGSLEEKCTQNSLCGMDLRTVGDGLRFWVINDTEVKVELRQNVLSSLGSYHKKSLTDLQSDAGAKLVFHINGDNDTLPVVYGESNIRDGRISLGYGINLDIQEAFLILNRNEDTGALVLELYYNSTTEVPIECDQTTCGLIVSEERIYKFINVDFGENQCLISKCLDDDK